MMEFFYGSQTSKDGINLTWTLVPRRFQIDLSELYLKFPSTWSYRFLIGDGDSWTADRNNSVAPMSLSTLFCFQLFVPSHAAETRLHSLRSHYYGRSSEASTKLPRGNLCYHSSSGLCYLSASDVRTILISIKNLRLVSACEGEHPLYKVVRYALWHSLKEAQHIAEINN